MPTWNNIFPTGTNGEQLFLFPTIGHFTSNGKCTIEIHGWCFQSTSRTKIGQAILLGIRRKLEKIQPLEDNTVFEDRAGGFAVASYMGCKIHFSIDGKNIGTARTKMNGHFKLKRTIDADIIKPHLQTTTHGTPVLSVEAIAKFKKGTAHATGEIHFLSQKGISIISDLDDTIRETNVADKQKLLENTFLRPFQSVEKMPLLFREWASRKAIFHYVSATPWQLFPVVTDFLHQMNFPQGSIHLRKFALKDLTLLKKLAPSHKGKRKTIERILTCSPQRNFYLYGDSGEKDPEIYGDIARKYVDQIKGVFIRNVTNESKNSLRFQSAFSHTTKNLCTVFNKADSLFDYIPK